MIELAGLTTASPKDTASNAWPDVAHYGVDVFHAFGNVGHTAFEEFLPEQYQECYIGYRTGCDKFVIGFDCWPDGDDSEYFGCNIFSFVLTEDGKITDIEMELTNGPFFYSDKSYGMLHEEYSDLFDIRLD